MVQRSGERSPQTRFSSAPEDLAYTLEPGGFLLHLWLPGTPLLTHLVPCQAAPVQRYADLEGA